MRQLATQLNLNEVYMDQITLDDLIKLGQQLDKAPIPSNRIMLLSVQQASSLLGISEEEVLIKFPLTNGIIELTIPLNEFKGKLHET